MGLEYHRDTAPADGAQLGRRQCKQVAPFEQGLSHRACAARETHDGLRRDALAGTRFADDAERPAAREVERDAAHRFDHAIRRVERDCEVEDLEQATGARRIVAGHGRFSAMSGAVSASQSAVSRHCCPRTDQMQLRTRDESMTPVFRSMTGTMATSSMTRAAASAQPASARSLPGAASAWSIAALPLRCHSDRNSAKDARPAGHRTAAR